MQPAFKKTFIVAAAWPADRAPTHVTSTEQLEFIACAPCVRNRHESYNPRTL